MPINLTAACVLSEQKAAGAGTILGYFKNHKIRFFIVKGRGFGSRYNFAEDTIGFRMHLVFFTLSTSRSAHSIIRSLDV